MTLRRRMASLWESLVLRSRLDGELDEELTSYLEESIDRKIRAGLGPAEARRAALAEMGGIQSVKDQVRTGRVGSGIASALRDLRHAWRTIFRMPGLSAVVVLSLGVWIVANTAAVSLIRAVLLPPLPRVP